MATRQPLRAKKIHPGACSSCVLCGKPQNRYTHNINWSQQQRDWLQQHLAIPVDESACICKRCGDNVKKGISDSQYKPRWVKLTSKPTTTCDVIGCHSKLSRSLKHTDLETLTKNGLNVKSNTHSSLAVCASHAMQTYQILNPFIPCN